jgi:hypothetical protein
MNILGMYARARGLYQAIALLLPAYLIYEALFLGRGLFEQSLHLQELASTTEDADRDRLVLNWMKDAAVRFKGLSAAAERAGLEKEPAAVRQAIEDEITGITDYAARKNLGRLKRFLPDEAAAKRFDRVEAWWTHELSEHMVHGSELASRFRRSQTADDTFGFRVLDSDPRMIATAVAWVAESILLSHKAAAQIFEWPALAEFDSLIAEVEELSRMDSEDRSLGGDGAN